MNQNDPAGGLVASRRKVLGNSLLVNLILRFLNTKDLETCEKVCVIWNEECGKLLRNHRIFSNIFALLSIPDLKNCRLVCKTWKRQADQLMKTKTKVVFRHTACIPEFISTFETIPGIFEQFEFCVLFENNLELIASLTNLIGVHVKYLRLEHCKWTWDILRSFLYEKMPNINELVINESFLPGTRTNAEIKRLRPEDRLVISGISPPIATPRWVPPPHPILLKMEKLTLNFHMIDPYRRTLLPRVEEFLSDIFQSVRNIESIIVDHDSQFILDFILHHPNLEFTKLTELKIPENFTALQMFNLGVKEFPLKSISVSINRPDFPAEQFYRLLTSLKDTLEYLKLSLKRTGNGQSEVVKEFEFPRSVSGELKKLKKIHISGQFIENFHFLQDFEKLEILELDRMDVSKIKFEDAMIYPQTSLFKNLRRLDMTDVVGNLDGAPFRNLFVTFSRTRKRDCVSDLLDQCNKYIFYQL